MVCQDTDLIDWKDVDKGIIIAGGESLPVKNIGILKLSLKNALEEDAEYLLRR
jgi:hypothetical protein